jgi:hypothetical protein
MKTSLSQTHLGLESTNASDANDAVSAVEANGIGAYGLNLRTELAD